MRFTPVIKILLIINLVFFIMSLIIEKMFGYDWFTTFNALYPFNDPHFEIYQYFTYMFMHGSFWHLFFNMWQLIIFGCAVEQIYGTKRFAVFYLLCGIGSAVAHQVMAYFGIIPPSPVVGASGAIYGVMGAAAFNFPNAKMFIIPFPFPIKLKWLVAGFAAYDLYSGISMSDGVAHFAHLGGLLVGLIIIFFWRYKDTHRKSSPEGYWTYSDTHSSYDRGSRSSISDKVKNVFSGHKGPKMTVVKNAGDRKADYEYNERKRVHNEEIDRILDKVRKGGFENLTEDEKRTLFDASKK